MTPTPTFPGNLTRKPTWRLRLAKKLRRLAYELDPDASVARKVTIDWEDRVLWVTPGFAEVEDTLMLGEGGSIRVAREFTGTPPEGQEPHDAP